MSRWGRLLLLGLMTQFIPWAGAVSAPAPVEQWDILEVTLEGPAEGNPFLEVELSATFTDGQRRMEVKGFYDGEGIYRIRFMPDRPGTWHYKTWCNDWSMTAQEGSFEVVPPGPGNHGPVHVTDTYHFAYADGTRYLPFGTTTYNWLHRPASLQETTLETLRGSPFNKLRMLIFPERLGVRTPPEIWPFGGTPPDDWDFSRFNPAFFQSIENDLILFNPYGEEWGFDRMPADVNDRYLRYIVSRFAAFRNVWWSMSNEYDFVKVKRESDWDHYFQVVQAEDPYQHLRSIHNGFLIYDHNKPWVTHASVQNGAAVEESGRAQMYRDVWRKPVVYDEVKYEGDWPKRWGNLSGEEMLHRVWSGVVAGTYVGHGECYQDPEEIVWLSTGGTLRGTSPSRIAFLRGILEAAPGYLDPVDKWQDARTGGIPGEYYLLYLGREAPDAWQFQLANAGVLEGQVYSVDIIDTWAMTVTPVEETFVTQRKDRYHFIDQGNRSVALPGKPYMALRITRIGGQSIAVEEEDPNR